MDFDSLQGVGAMVGSGGLVVMNRHTCMVSVARFFMQFTQNESCGKCVLLPRRDQADGWPCWTTSSRVAPTSTTLDLLEQLAKCGPQGLAYAAWARRLRTPCWPRMRYFRPELEAHVFQKRCPAGRRCKALRTPEIRAELCKGCTICSRKCSGRGDFRRAEDAAQDRPRQVHQVWRVCRTGVQVPCDRRSVAMHQPSLRTHLPAACGKSDNGPAREQQHNAER